MWVKSTDQVFFTKAERKSHESFDEPTMVLIARHSLYLHLDRRVAPVHLRYLRLQCRDMLAVWDDTTTHILVTPCRYFYFTGGRSEMVTKLFLGKRVEIIDHSPDMTFETFVRYYISPDKHIMDQVVDAKGDAEAALVGIAAYKVGEMVYKQFGGTLPPKPKEARKYGQKNRRYTRFDFLTVKHVKLPGWVVATVEQEITRTKSLT